MKGAFVLSLFVIGALCDVYMHSPRGSNNRVAENNVNRNNANRLYDSQNNGKGGYCVGPAMYFYVGSLLAVEWTNQHGCGNPRLYCNVVLQYMCGKKDAPAQQFIRDGTTTDRVPNTDAAVLEQDANGIYTFGVHEPRSNYVACSTRERNMGLFIADREEEGNLNEGRRSAIFTRQNNNGNRHGFECAEERDYYPYWHPSPWIDIAVLAATTEHCDVYKKESQNVKSKGQCMTNDGAPAEQNNKVACQAEGNKWEMVKSHGKAAPDCIKSPWSRENHLGNSAGGEGHTASYNWTIPSIDEDEERCVLRIRYNISVQEIDNSPGKSFTDSKKNALASPVTDDEIVTQDGLPHQLALDTSQFGRTFEDRSHVFMIKKRPNKIPDQARIYNLNVRGKRGNIVEAYPAVEYDFVPTHLNVYKNDYIHFQWTGCDQNPGGNAGEGTASTDRSNIVQVQDGSATYPASDKWLKSNTPLFQSTSTRKRFAMLDQPVDNPQLCKTFEQLLAENNNNENTAEQDTENCMKLNAAAQYFDGGALQMNLTGTFYYMSSRNHNFSNRDQKGTIVVSNLLPTWAIVIVVLGAVMFLAAAGVAVGLFYSRSHPHSSVAKIFSKL